MVNAVTRAAVIKAPTTADDVRVVTVTPAALSANRRPSHRTLILVDRDAGEAVEHLVPWTLLDEPLAVVAVVVPTNTEPNFSKLLDISLS